MAQENEEEFESFECLPEKLLKKKEREEEEKAQKKKKFKEVLTKEYEKHERLARQMKLPKKKSQEISLDYARKEAMEAVKKNQNKKKKKK